LYIQLYDGYIHIAETCSCVFTWDNSCV